MEKICYELSLFRGDLHNLFTSLLLSLDKIGRFKRFD